MATNKQLGAFRKFQDDLSTVAFKDLRALLAEVNGVQDGVEVRNALIRAYPDLIGPYLSASAEYSAVWYEDLRRDANVAGNFSASLSDTVPVGQFDALIRYAVTPMFKPSTATVFTLLAGQTQKLIAGAGRATIESNAARERTVTGYQRVPAPGCCAFCALLAGRGATYSSEARASQVGGRGVSTESTAGKSGGQGKGIRTRGVQKVGDKYHDFCRCTAAPVWSDESWNHEIRDKYAALYEGGSNLQDALQTMRSKHGLS